MDFWVDEEQIQLTAKKSLVDRNNRTTDVFSVKEDAVGFGVLTVNGEGMLWPHFGKAPQVTFFNVEDGQIKDTTVLQAPEHQHGAMPRFLAEQHCTDVICGGIGGGAVELLNQLGIRIHGGAPEMEVAEVIKLFLNGTLTYGDSSCHHHCEGHHH